MPEPERKVITGPWKVGPLDSRARRGMSEASRRGRITAAQRADYERLREHEARPWLVRHWRVCVALLALAAGLALLGAGAWLVLNRPAWLVLALAVGVFVVLLRAPARRRRRRSSLATWLRPRRRRTRR